MSPDSPGVCLTCASSLVTLALWRRDGSDPRNCTSGASSPMLGLPAYDSPASCSSASGPSTRVSPGWRPPEWEAPAPSPVGADSVWACRAGRDVESAESASAVLNRHPHRPPSSEGSESLRRDCRPSTWDGRTSVPFASASSRSRSAWIAVMRPAARSARIAGMSELMTPNVWPRATLRGIRDDNATTPGPITTGRGTHETHEVVTPSTRAGAPRHLSGPGRWLYGSCSGSVVRDAIRRRPTFSPYSGSTSRGGS